MAALSLVGGPGTGAGAQTLQAAREMQAAGSFAEEFFNDIRDERYEEAFTKMDRKVQKLGRAGVAGVLRTKRHYLIGDVAQERYTFVTAREPLQALSCLEAGDRKQQRKLYLSARLIQRSADEGWKVLSFKVASVPASGCPA